MNGSEIAQLRQQIECEYQAGRWALHGLASGLAQHQFITARFQHMEQCHKRLAELVGEEQATEYLCEVFNNTEASEQDLSQIETWPQLTDDARIVITPSDTHEQETLH